MAGRRCHSDLVFLDIFRVLVRPVGYILDLQEDGLMTAVKARWPKIQAVTQYKRGEA